MKRPLPIKLFYLIAGLVLVAGATLYLVESQRNHWGPPEGFEGEGEEGEENEGAQIIGAFDMWGDMRNYPNDNLTNANYLGAFAFSKSLPEAHAAINPAARVEASAWIPLAPKNFSGRILSLAFHPTNPNIMFAGSASGGLWKTTNGGTGAVGGINWQQVPTGFPVLGIPAIAINPANANIMYIGTGEIYNTGGYGTAGQNIRAFRGSYGVGIYKSVDAGVTWDTSLYFANSSIKGVQEILIDPVTPSNVFAATSDGLYRSTSSGAKGTWTLVAGIPIMAMDICINPGNANTMYVACGNFGSTGAGIYKSTNALAATPTFTELTTGLPATPNGRIALSIVPNNTNIIFASVGKIPGTAGAPAANYGLFKSTDAGATWAKTANQPILAGANYIQNQGWYSHDVIAAPTTVNTVYVAEIDMLKSTDGGANFSQITDWADWSFTNTTIDPAQEGSTTQYVHADQHHLYFSPFDATYNTIFVVSDGGVFKSTDAGANFKGLNGGLMTAQIYHNMSSSATNSTYMLCGLQDNATFWYQGSAGCRRVTVGGDGFSTAISPANDQICFSEYSYMTIYKSSTGPANFSGTPVFNNYISAPADLATSTPPENACFVAPFVICPSAPTRMYGGTINFKRSNTTGAAGSFANIGPSPLVHAAAPIIGIGVSQTFADSVYAVTCPGGGFNAKVLRSINGGTNFTDVSTGLPNRYISDIAVDPTNSKRLAVTISGFGTSHLYLSPDAGATWNDIGGVGATALPDVPANVVMFDPAAPSVIYVGNDLGVYVAQGITNGSTQPAWYSYNTGLTDATLVMDLLVAPNGKIRMGTYGKGLWENDKAVFPLPVVFKDFNVTVTDRGNLVKWTIATQANVARYEVEYSTDAFNYKKVATVPVQLGSSDLTYTYLHTIQNTTDGYYRIKIVDLDGVVSYSSIAQVKAKQPITRFTAYPNPTTGVFKISIPSGANGTYNLTVHNTAGQLVVEKKLSLLGTREVTVDISGFAAGAYEVVLTDDKATKWTTRILKRH